MLNDSSNDSERHYKKRQKPFQFGPAVYNSPLGFQYTQPMVFNFKGLDLGTTDENISIRRKRPASIRGLDLMYKRKKMVDKDERSSSTAEETPAEDPHEKLLEYSEEKNAYLVKYRGKSYLHCDWVPAERLQANKHTSLKVRKFSKNIGVNPDFVKVERVINEIDDEQNLVLIKWKGLAIEHASFEYNEVAKKCEGFTEAYNIFKARLVQNSTPVPLEYRPSKELQKKYTKSPGFKNDNTLREYQLEGLNWLMNRWYYKTSCIMADEMGLGKTVQSVTFIDSIFKEFDYCAPCLIVAPLSTIVHWEREFAAWTDLRVVTYHGSSQGRQVINDYEFSHESKRLFDVIITTYEMCMFGLEHLSRFDYGIGIFDEAHRLKNVNSKAFKVMIQFSISHKVLLSGTPIQNNINELWALFHFIDPQRFNSIDAFLEEYKLDNADDVARLQDLLKPLMLRRLKEDVETSIPQKEETIIEVELTTIQKRYYRAIIEKNMEFLKKDSKANVPNLVNTMMELRKCCSHPFLLKGAEEKIINEYFKKKEFKKKTEVNPYLNPTQTGKEIPDNTNIEQVNFAKPIIIGDHVIKDLDEYYRILIQSSGKLVLLDKLLTKLQNGHKVLIFSQMTMILDILADYLIHKRFTFERIDGGIRGDLRQAAIDRFSNGETFVFLLCTRAGGVGINLTAADTVIIFDSDWNPQNDLQAQARCHRIGQKQEVKIYRLITRNTYEREMFNKAGMKLGLDKAILQRMSFEKETEVKKEESIQLLLRKGAYGVLMDNDEAGEKFCQEDIEQILSKRTTKVTLEGEGGNVFSKATFQVDEDVDDPNFWDNLLSSRKNQESEGRLKRLCRKFSREGTLTNNDCLYIKIFRYGEEEINDQLVRTDAELPTEIPIELDQNVVEPGKEKTKSSKSDRTQKKFVLYRVINEEIKFDPELLTTKNIYSFIKRVLLNGTEDIDIYGENGFPVLNAVVSKCLTYIEDGKSKDDHMYNINHLVTDFDNRLFVPLEEFVKIFHYHFLFRIQIPIILNNLLKTEPLIVEKARGWNHVDDEIIVKSVLTKGYDVISVLDKPKEDVNQRVRKIILSLNTRKEIKENDNMYYKSIIKFGRPTELNMSAIEKSKCKDPFKLRDIIDNLLRTANRHLRRETIENECIQRAKFFDKLFELDDVPLMRRQFMPRGWTIEKDYKLREHLLSQGFDEIKETFNIDEDTAVKRFELLFKAVDRKEVGRK